MNDKDLSLALDRLVADRKRVAAPSTLHERVWAIPTTTAGERRRVPRLETRFTVVPALQFVAAAVIVALFGGFLLSGVLTKPQGDDLVPAAVSTSPSYQAEPPIDSDAGSITLEVKDLVGMKGLELVGKVWGPVSPRIPRGEDPGVENLHLSIDTDRFSASGRVPLQAGDYYMWVFAGEPPCDASFMPVCADTDRANANQGFFCMVSFDVRSGEDIRTGLSGLPPRESDLPNPCPVEYWERRP